MSKVIALYHIVFGTKNRSMTITNDYRKDLYRFIWKILDNNNCYLYRIGVITNHLHMLINLDPKIALADIMRDIKGLSSKWLKEDIRFPMFEGWGKEYFAATIGINEKNSVIEYINAQQSHHSVKSFDDEMKYMCEYNGFNLYEDDFR